MPESKAWSPEEVTTQLEEALRLYPFRWSKAWSVRRSLHEHVVFFDRPQKTVAISLTGVHCDLKCAHCGGHYLRHMQPIWDLSTDTATSCLISGGCDQQGQMPLTNHLEIVKQLHKTHRLNWHVGLIDEEALERIAPYSDVISFDLVGDSETAREVYGLELGLADYMDTLSLLRRHASVVPHITIGLRGGELSGERQVIEALSRIDLEALIFIVLIPTKGTTYADRLPPLLGQVADLFLQARVQLPNTRLYLGCMRPFSEYRRAIDQLAIRAGFNGIVNPTLKAERLAGDLGLRVIWGEECCALHHQT